jgi:TRAP-type C4-dicarboxylate transport system permease large subunit
VRHGERPYGSISGSPTADVATTGPLTIPIMKKMGVPAARAGAIEATASSGGAMLPPVMGAVAFIMSDITNIRTPASPGRRWIPALLYYYSIYLLVHNEAVRHAEPRLPEEQIVPLKRALASGWRHLLPLGALIGLLIAGYTPVYVAAGATAAVIVLSWFTGRRRSARAASSSAAPTPSRSSVPLVGAVAAAGVVIGAIEISALAGKFTLMINMLSGGLLVPTLLLSALFLVLLGMGMPTPAVYIMGAALLAPVLRGVFNLPEMQVHLFMLYFACLSAVTPPVAVANFAAGAIAGVNPMALGPYAVKLAIGGFILPFYFLFNPGLNMQGSPLYIIECIVFAIAMCTFASFAMQGFLGLRSIAWPLRLLLFGCAVATVSPRFGITLAATVLGIATLRPCLFARPPSAGRRFRRIARRRRAAFPLSLFFESAQAASAPVGSTTIFMRSHRKNMARVSSAVGHRQHVVHVAQHDREGELAERRRARAVGDGVGHRDADQALLDERLRGVVARRRLDPHHLDARREVLGGDRAADRSPPPPHGTISTSSAPASSISSFAAVPWPAMMWRVVERRDQGQLALGGELAGQRLAISCRVYCTTSAP